MLNFEIFFGGVSGEKGQCFEKKQLNMAKKHPKIIKVLFLSEKNSFFANVRFSDHKVKNRILTI